MSREAVTKAIDIVRNGLFCGHTQEDILANLYDLRDAQTIDNELQELRDFVRRAFVAHPNLDLDIKDIP